MEINRTKSIFHSHENIKLTTIFQPSSMLRYRQYFNVDSMSNVDSYSTLKLRPYFNVDSTSNVDSYSTLKLRPYFNVDSMSNVDSYSTLKLRRCINVEKDFGCGDVVNNIQPYFSVDTTLCVCWIALQHVSNPLSLCFREQCKGLSMHLL